MSMTVENLRAAKLYGKKKVERWMKEREREWMKPDSDLVMLTKWEAMSDEDRAAMKQQAPEEYEALEAYIATIKG